MVVAETSALAKRLHAIYVKYVQRVGLHVETLSRSSEEFRKTRSGQSNATAARTMRRAKGKVADDRDALWKRDRFQIRQNASGSIRVNNGIRIWLAQAISDLRNTPVRSFPQISE
jgi:hypothetical protein